MNKMNKHFLIAGVAVLAIAGAGYMHYTTPQNVEGTTDLASVKHLESDQDIAGTIDATTQSITTQKRNPEDGCLDNAGELFEYCTLDTEDCSDSCGACGVRSTWNAVAWESTWGNVDDIGDFACNDQTLRCICGNGDTPEAIDSDDEDRGEEENIVFTTQSLKRDIDEFVEVTD